MLNISPIETHQLGLLGIADNSDYGTSVPNNPSFEITPPGFNKINVPFQPKAINVFTGADLGLGCDNPDLPDGIYTVKYTVNNEFIEKQFMRISKIICNYQKKTLILFSDCGCYSNEQKQLQRIKLFIEGSVAAANDCQIQVSKELYKKASDLLKRMKNCNC